MTQNMIFCFFFNLIVRNAFLTFLTITILIEHKCSLYHLILHYIFKVLKEVKHYYILLKI